MYVYTNDRDLYTFTILIKNILQVDINELMEQLMQIGKYDTYQNLFSMPLSKMKVKDIILMSIIYHNEVTQ